MSPVALRAALPLALALLITAFGGVLRLDALVQKYGALDRPGWARILTRDIAPIGRKLQPASHEWRREAQPYIGGDPINYLRYAREMRGFYQAHVREPVFLALTRGFLWALDGQDVAVSFASAAGSTLAIFAVYLLGASLISRAAGLVAALILAGEYQVITWAVDGWRDDTFMATVVFAAWAFIRFREHPTVGSALLLGVAAAAACLTRITALSFVLPALAWLIVDCAAEDFGLRARMASFATLMCGALVAPYLVSCAAATGDPLYAINYHTGYYRHGEGLPSEQPMNAAAYIASKVARSPVTTLDTAATGLFVQPFTSKWNGLDAWVPPLGLGRKLSWCAVAGLLMLPFTADGRLLLLILFTSLLPYAFTWNTGGGGEWRFTMHAYPLYIVAAVYAVDRAARGVIHLWRERRGRIAIPWGPVIALTVFVMVCAGGYMVLPWFVVREAIAGGRDISIETGSRDLPFFGAGWTPPHTDGVTVRFARAERAIVRLPLPIDRPYDLILRLDPVAPDLQRRVTVLFNRQVLGVLHLTWNAERMGSYRLRVPAEKIKEGINELALVTDALVPAASAGARLAWLDPDERVGVRLWYVRVLGPGQ
jgi:4-amino-4-deoxy-L-arabinose transferase-like glycosyltransferase